MKNILAIVLIIIFSCSISYMNQESTGASMYSLDVSNFGGKKIENGSKMRINLQVYYVGEKALKWWTSNKKIKIIKKKKKHCIIRAKKPGKCFVKCLMKDCDGKKHKLKIKITVKPKSKVTYDHYLDIEKGMSFNWVKKKLGKPYRHDSTYKYDDEIYDDDYDVVGYDHIREDSYTWYNPFKSIYIYVDFRNWKVTDMRYAKY